MTGAVQVPAGPRVRNATLARLPIAAGRYLASSYLKPMSFSDYPLLEPTEITTGIYLITDLDQRVRWLGQANRDGGLIARLDEHARSREKAAVFATLRILHLVDLTPPDMVDVIEGRCADLLKLRGTMGPRRWPSADDWLARVA